MQHLEAMKVEFRYLSEEETRHDKSVLYVRWKGRRIRLKLMPSQPGFTAEYQAALDALKERAKAPAPKIDPRVPFAEKTFGWLVERYFEESPQYRTMNPIGRARRRKILEGVKETHGRANMLMRPSSVAAGLAKRSETPGAANDWLKSIKALYTWAKSINLITESPAAGITKIEQDTEGFYTWTMEDIAAYVKRHPIGTMPYLAIMLLIFTGLRRSDAARFGRQHCKGDKISFKTSKTGAELLTKTPWPLAEAIDAMPVSTELTLLLNVYGRPFASGNAFGNWFKDRCAEAGLPQCTAHGLRKAGATICSENGGSEVELEAMYGWSNNRQSGTYTRAARNLLLATKGFERISEAMVAQGVLSAGKRNKG